ncbi:MAG: LarC family nickel insertion protein, partial [Chloroflexi bacterium]|nr:LarC family nickel insertion protein [Chloroflexota bacterium]
MRLPRIPMKTAYIQSVGGASGDMLLGALLDAGLPLDAIHDAIAALKIPNVNITTATETRCEVRGSRAVVDTTNAPRYSPRQMLDAVNNAAALSDQTRTRATAVLNALFAAESRVHGAKPENIHPHEPGVTDTSVGDYLDQIHLHELGTADTLVDVVGVVHGLEQLGIHRIYASPLVLGEATGPRRPNGYSNPAPATLEIIAAANAPVAPERPVDALSLF